MNSFKLAPTTGAAAIPTPGPSLSAFCGSVRKDNEFNTADKMIGTETI